jgi:cytoskeletal protein CcmA (bactofilin family)
VKFSQINHFAAILKPTRYYGYWLGGCRLDLRCVYSWQRPSKYSGENYMAAGDSTTATIGKSVQIRGEVKGSEDLLVDGVVEGTITLSESRLTIGANARVQANVAARDVVIQGTLNGNITATGRVEMRSGSRVIGDLKAARLAIEENAVFSGKVDLVQSSGSAEKPAAAVPQAAVAPAEKPGALFGATK